MQANIDTKAIKYTEIGRKIITMETKHLRMNNKRGTATKLNGEAVDDGRIHVPGIQNMRSSRGTETKKYQGNQIPGNYVRQSEVHGDQETLSQNQNQAVQVRAQF